VRHVLTTVLLALSVVQSFTPAASLEQLFATPPDGSRIMMRWWWFGPSVTQDELEAEMRRMKEGGIGGFEIATVYPMAVDDAARGIHNYPYLSPEYLDAIGFAARKARELGLRMDVTLGSGWSFGGPYITPDLAAARLRSDRREIAPAVTRIARPVPHEHERLIAAFIGRGSVHEVDADSFRELDVAGDGPIALPPGAGPRTLIFYFASHTGQVVKRAALGAEGYVLDHYNRAAIEKHLHEVGDKLVAAAGGGGIHAIFCDSLEVYDADWTGDMLEEFGKRRGYDLRPLLPLLEYGAAERSQNVRRDLGRTQTELYEERFLTPMREWSRKNDVLFRIQNYGQPPASLASSRYADLVDGEGFDWRALSATRWASSAAHLYGKAVTASETWTWIHSPAFRATPLDMKAEADLHFLAGINQLIGHGWPYSPPQAGTPGWPFYAAGAFTDKNPWWPVMSDLARYLQRVSFVLRQGDPVADVALYAPTEDARAAMRPGTAAYLNLWMAIRDSIGPKIIPAILDGGYSFELIDDGTLKEAEARKYKVVVLPGVRWMPEATTRWLAEYVRTGGTVLAVRRAPEGDVQSFPSIAEEDVPRRLAAAVQPDVDMAPPSCGIGFVHRHLPDADVYFLANTRNLACDADVRFRSQRPYAEVWDPFTGLPERLDPSNERIALHFDPYVSRVVVFRATAASSAVTKKRSTIASRELSTGWTVTVGKASARTIDLPHSWTMEAATRYFSGTAVYRRTFEVPVAFRAAGTRVYLDFGDARPIEREALPDGTLRGNSFAALVAPPIREAAIVFMNDRRAGSLWAPPYRVDVTDYLRDGVNDIRIEVYNTAINAMAEGDRIPDVRAVVERYGQRFRLQDLEGLRPLESGVLAVPRIVAER
jgi:alpha-L-rhamnosidase